MEGNQQPWQETGAGQPPWDTEMNRMPWEPDDQAPLREWQKNTWYGPAPVNENPFDEPEDAPELREMRSESLNNRSGAFWETDPQHQITGGYRFGVPKNHESPTASGTRDAEKKAKARKHRPWHTALLGFAAAAALWALLYYVVFTVRDVRIVGNDRIPASEIIRLSGVRTGMPLLSLSGETVEQRLKQNPTLKFRYMEKQMPGTVILAVKEREACCWMTWNGILYTMDKQRMVLYETEDLSVRPSELVKVDGLEIRSTAIVGQTLMLDRPEQQEIYSNLFLEMKVLGCTELIEEADLSNISSLLLTTRDGFTVSLGDAGNIHAKLRAMLITRDELLRRGYQGGVINVILPESPVFSPATV